MWEMRHPMEIGEIFEGMELGGVLESLVATFTAISSHTGRDGAVGRRTAPAHRNAGRAVLHRLQRPDQRPPTLQCESCPRRPGFRGRGLRMSIADDGTGLPDDYATRGQGFRNMREEAERLGGSLVVETNGSEWRTAVTCVLPYRHMKEGAEMASTRGQESCWWTTTR